MVMASAVAWRAAMPALGYGPAWNDVDLGCVVNAARAIKRQARPSPVCACLWAAFC